MLSDGAMTFESVLSRARVLLLALPLYALTSTVQVGCGSVGTTDLGTNASHVTAYGTYGRDGNGHYGFYGYYGCSDGYGFVEPGYGYGCDDGKTDGYGYGGYGYGP